MSQSRIDPSALEPDPGLFRDANFKLAVIARLMERGGLEFGPYPDFLRWLEGPQYDYEAHGHLLSEKARDYFTRYPLSPRQRGQIEVLEFDGGLDIYPFIFPFWSGESDDFDIRSLVDLQLLPNLRRFGAFSMLQSADLGPVKDHPALEVLTLGLIGQEWVRLSSLLTLPRLTHVTAFRRDITTARNRRVLATLKSRGVTVQLH
ncbi:hypothetical protein N4R57_14490 [Rhodobacteraceae bacterium D3-12]|nr:hypothetical protein N4R57_14490 [Rhodobacteraceae bacterium D3-12]